MNYFIGKTKPWLESELAKAQADYSAGKVIINVSSGDVTTGKMIHVNVQDRIERLLIALNALDSTTYPDLSIRRISRTRVTFSSS